MKINRTNISDHLVEYQLNMVGKTIAEAYKNENWFHEWTMTEEQHDQFRAYAIPLLKKVFKCNRRKAEATFGWFDLSFGLRIDNEKTYDDDEDLEDLKL
jgi:hypothetical protein